MSSKHAYLIMAHNQPELLKCLLKALDHEENDIYLHLDIKMKDVDVQALCSQIRRGTICVLSHRLDVQWGDFSQIECELLLLSEATKTPHVYYHLMSGVDMPLKSQEEIHRFFSEHRGTEFIQFEAPEISKQTKQRVAKFHFGNKKRSNKSILDKVCYRASLLLQCFVDRTRNTPVTFQKGANWFSITDACARSVLEKRDFIDRHFRHSNCGDEMFLQTIVYNSPFRERVCGNNYCDNYDNILYCIDWERGDPYEYTVEDYTALIGSGMLFARKFNWAKDSQVITMLLEHAAREA